jgi:hypothetical protein
MIVGLSTLVRVKSSERARWRDEFVERLKRGPRQARWYKRLVTGAGRDSNVEASFHTDPSRDAS